MDWLNDHLSKNLYYVKQNHTFDSWESMTSGKEDSLVDSNTSAAQLGITTGVIVALMVKYNFTRMFQSPIKENNIIIGLEFKLIFGLVVIVALFPFFTGTLMVCYLCKIISKCLIKYYDEDFVEIMDSTDIVWTLKDGNSRSIINIIALVEAESHILLQRNIQRKMLQLYGKKCDKRKLFYLRASAFGFSYWKKNKNIDFDDYIKVLNASDDYEIEESELEDLVATYANAPFGSEDTQVWQIIVSSRKMKRKDKTFIFPIIFRIHHSLGDGVALFSLLCNNMADMDSGNYKPFDYSKNKLVKTNYLKNIIDFLGQSIFIPASLVRQAIRPIDENIVHGPYLSGKKVVTWLHKDDDGYYILESLKRFKMRFPGLKFSDFLMTAVSSGLTNYFMQNNESSLPRYVTAVVPARTNGNITFDVPLENKFSVALADVPIIIGAPTSAKLLTCQKLNDKLRNSTDHVANYYIIKVLAGVLPDAVLRRLLVSKHATCVISNLPGPKSFQNFCGFPLKDLVFFLPQKGTTGIGISALSYAGRLKFGLIADKALIDSTKKLNIILHGIIDEVKKMELMTSAMTDLKSQ